MRACERPSQSALGVLKLFWGQGWPTPVGLDGSRQEKVLAEQVGRLQPLASPGACSSAGRFPGFASLSLGTLVVIPDPSVGFIPRFTKGPKGTPQRRFQAQGSAHGVTHSTWAYLRRGPGAGVSRDLTTPCHWSHQTQNSQRWQGPRLFLAGGADGLFTSIWAWGRK